MSSVVISWTECDCEWETKYCAEEHRQYAVVDREALGPLIGVASPQAASKGSALSERVEGRPNRHSASEGDE